MKKMTCVLISVLSLFCLVGCDVNEMSSLKDISKPYAAEYRCESLTFGGEELIGSFKYIKLDLGADGKFELNYCNVNGAKGSYEGNYSFGENGVTFTCLNGAKTSTFTFPYDEGNIYLELPICGRVLKAKFET